MSDNTKSEKKAFIRLTFWTLTILGVMTCLNALFIINSVGNDVFQPLKRNLASVQEQEEQVAEKITSPIIKFDCKSKKSLKKVHTKAKTARFTFVNCKEVEHLTNESNNSQGDLFALKNKQWTSDFILLSPGQNHIKTKAGDRIQVVEINRVIINSSPTNKAL